MSNSGYLLRSLLLSVLATFSYLASSSEVNYRVCTDPNWLPYEALDENGHHIGIASEFFRHISQQLGITEQLIFQPSDDWGSTMSLIRTGQCDLVPMLNKSAQRQQYLSFSDVYLESPIVVIHRTQNRIHRTEDIYPLHAALVDDYFYNDHIATKISHKTFYPTMKEAIRSVSRGETDVTFSAMYIYSSIIRELQVSNLNAYTKTPWNNAFRIGVGPKATPLLPAINQAIASVSYQQKHSYINRWLPDKTLESENLLAEIAIISIPVSLMFATVIFIKYRRTQQILKTDKLTRCLNRHGFHIEYQALQRRYSAHSELALILFDIDHFKAINDQYGHNTGDQVISMVADMAGQNIRRGDLLCRWGGEEFIIICPDTTQTEAAHIAEDLRRLISNQTIEPLIQPVTASFGVASGKTQPDLSSLIEQADQRLYDSKRSGRNRVSA